MPRLRHLLDSMLLGLIERRSGDRPSDQPPRNAASTQREIDALTVLVRERDAEIERLKATDAKRSSILRKNAATRRQKRHETKDLRRKNRAQLRLLKKRRGKLRVLMQRLRDMKPIFAAQSASKSLAGETLPLPFDQTPARTLIEWLYRKLANASLWPWRHWMRLGYHSQYDPRPLVLDRIPAPHGTPAAWPRISLVTPSYQQAAFLERTMCSVLDQNYPNLEYFVLDGGSQDGSVETIQQHASRLAGWSSKPDGGQAAAVREGLDQATGDIMAWLNSDDVIFPGTLEPPPTPALRREGSRRGEKGNS